MNVFLAIDKNYHSFDKIPHLLNKSDNYFIRDSHSDNELRNELLNKEFSVIQSTLVNRTPLERIESLLKIVDKVIIFTNDIDSSSNRFFINKKDVIIYDKDANKISKDIDGIDEYVEEQDSTVKYCNYYESAKKVPKTIKMIDLDSLVLEEPKKMKRSSKKKLKKKEPIKTILTME